METINDETLVRHSRSIEKAHKKRKKEKRNHSSSSSSSPDNSTKKSKKRKKKKRNRSRSTSSTSSVDSFKSKKKKKRVKKKKKKEKKAKKSAASADAICSTDLCHVALPPDGREPAEVKNEAPEQKKRAMVPMTKEEYDRQRGIVRRVYDPETGRNRLIRGEGEVIEEIVSKARHKQINKLSTLHDGQHFASSIGLNR